MLEVHHLHKKYPGEHYGAVVDVSFELSKGEILAVVGRSGSGKSSLLRMLAGLMKPDSGEILFNNEPLKNPEEQLVAGHDQIKMVFQDFQVKANMTVVENIRYKLLHFNKEYQKERCEELLELCGLVSLADKKPHELSGGQQQRLSLARALADDPELLLMDEPFSNLDPLIKEDLMLELVQIVKSENLSLILVSHDVRDAMLIADQIAFIEQGTILQLDTPTEIYNRPKTLEVAQFFGRVNELKFKQKQIFVRAEHLKEGLLENSFNLKVIQSIFMGAYHLNYGISDENERVVFHSQEGIPIDRSVKLGFKSSDQLQFS